MASLTETGEQAFTTVDEVGRRSFLTVLEDGLRVFAGGATIIPAAALAIAATVSPTVVLGSTSSTPAPATAIAATVNPTVTIKSVDPSEVVAATVNPSVVLGSVAVTPAPSLAIPATVNPSFVYGSTSATPAPAVAIPATRSPSISLSFVEHVTVRDVLLSDFLETASALASGLDDATFEETVIVLAELAGFDELVRVLPADDILEAARLPVQKRIGAGVTQ